MPVHILSEAGNEQQKQSDVHSCNSKTQATIGNVGNKCHNLEEKASDHDMWRCTIRKDLSGVDERGSPGAQ